MVATFLLVSLAVWDRNKYGQHFPNNSPQTHISFHLYLQLALQEMTQSLSTIVRRGDRRIIMRVQISSQFTVARWMQISRFSGKKHIHKHLHSPGPSFFSLCLIHTLELFTNKVGTVTSDWGRKKQLNGVYTRQLMQVKASMNSSDQTCKN